VQPIAAYSALWLGLIAGGRHAAFGPDHFAGVAPFAAASGRSGWRVGVAWGLGHASGAACAAVLALLLRASIPGVEEQLSGISDRIVGVLMCCVGALGLRAALSAGSRAHEHAGVVHAHPTLHLMPTFRNRVPARPAQPAKSAYVLGLFHGAGGLSHLFAVLPAMAFPGVALPALYLAGYALGSLTLITAFAVGVGRFAPAGRPRLQRRVLALASALSLLVGLAWIVHPL
jgi:hypothetical protein